jgi:hypothetical protein
MPFSEEKKTYSETRKRTGAEYLKFTPEYRTVARILNPTAKTVWKHYIQAANGGRGSGAVCPNVSSDLKVCPIEAEVANLPKEDPKRREANARRKFVVNVLDRTPYTTCPSCNAPTPGKTVPGKRTKDCINCGADLKGADFKPLNKVKILESGPKLFNEQLNVIEQMQKDELDVDITAYDITFTTQGTGRDRSVTAMPQDPKPLEDDAFVDPETGEEQKLFDLELLGEPALVEEIILMLQGATQDQINAVRGVAA